VARGLGVSRGAPLSREHRPASLIIFGLALFAYYVLRFSGITCLRLYEKNQAHLMVNVITTLIVLELLAGTFLLAKR
jgi:hypothetical protein